MPIWPGELLSAYIIHLFITFVIGFFKGAGWRELTILDLARI